MTLTVPQECVLSAFAYRPETRSWWELLRMQSRVTRKGLSRVISSLEDLGLVSDTCDIKEDGGLWSRAYALTAEGETVLRDLAIGCIKSVRPAGGATGQ